MNDVMHEETDKQIAKTSKRLAKEYKQAEKELKKKFKDYTKKFAAEDKAKAKLVKNGELSNAEYLEWRKSKLLRSEIMQAKVDSMAQHMVNVDKQAANIVNGTLAGVYAENYNFATYGIEKGFKINTGLALHDEKTVERLAHKYPRLLPKSKVNIPKDQIWQKRKIVNAITQGILQGEAIDDIADRLTKVASMGWNSAVRNARTAMTGAQNAGRLGAYEDSAKLGINLKKQWMATLDERTRESHQELDGESVPVDEPFSNGLMYPADPSGEPEEVYNCRCTMVADLVDYPDEGFERYVNGESVGDMTYKEWAAAKDAEQVLSGFDYAKYGGEDVYNTLAKYTQNVPADLGEDYYSHLLGESTADEWSKITKAFNNEYGKIDEALNEIAKIEKAKATQKAAQESAKIKKELANAEKTAKKLEAEINAKGANKVFKNIWKDDVTCADWETKKAGIQGKKDYFKQQIANGKDVDKFNALLKDLEEFEKHGAEYSKLLSEYQKAQRTIAEARMKSAGADAAYSKARKDAAVWARDGWSGASKRSEYLKADEYFDELAKKVHATKTSIEHEGYYHYTWGSGPFNSPLAGFESGFNTYGHGFLGVGKVDIDVGGYGEKIRGLTSLCEKSKYDKDFWVQSGQHDATLESFLGIPYDTLSSLSESELQQFVGVVNEIPQFISGSINKGGGSYNPGDLIFNIYCPKGSEALYVREDGHFHKSEHEMILQRGGTYKITRIYMEIDTAKGGKKLFVDMELRVERGYDKFQQ